MEGTNISKYVCVAQFWYLLMTSIIITPPGLKLVVLDAPCKWLSRDPEFGMNLSGGREDMEETSYSFCGSWISCILLDEFPK